MDIEIEALRSRFSYDPETGLITRTASCIKGSVGRVVGSKGQGGYLQVNVFGKNYRCHRLAWALHYGKWPDGEIDHFDGNPENNKINNLRDVSHKQNMHNQSKPQASNPYIGVRQAPGGKWRAGIKLNGKVIHIGIYDTPELAREAYLDTKQQLHYLSRAVASR